MMNRSLWRRRISEQFVPKYPCPRCSNGYLVRREDSFIERQPKHVHYDENETTREPFPRRFVMLLDCNDPACGEVVTVSGAGYDIIEEDSGGHVEAIGYLDPFSMWPPPPIFKINKRIPHEVFDEIDLSFQMYWADPRVAASRLRTSLERLMDHFKVAKTRVMKPSPNKPGKRVRLDLSARIDKFAKKINTTKYSEMLHALRVVGNLGTHGGKVTATNMLDAYQLYEMALNQIFEDKTQSIEAIIKRLKVKEVKQA